MSLEVEFYGFLAKFVLFGHRAYSILSIVNLINYHKQNKLTVAKLFEKLVVYFRIVRIDKHKNLN